jgi:hypothetical protein
MPLIIPMPTKAGVLLCILFTGKDEMERLASGDPPMLTGNEFCAAITRNASFPQALANCELSGIDVMICYEPDKTAFLQWLASGARSAGEVLERFQRNHKPHPDDSDAMRDLTALMKVEGTPN